MSYQTDIVSSSKWSVSARFLWGGLVDVLKAFFLGLHVESFLGSLLFLEVIYGE